MQLLIEVRLSQIVPVETLVQNVKCVILARRELPT